MISSDYEKYAEDHTSPETVLLKRLYRDTYLKTVCPRMISGHLQGRFLEMISFMIRPSRILEIGTFTGYSTICLASGLKEEGMIHTVDVMPEYREIFSRYFKEAGISGKVTAHTGRATDIIPGIDEVFDLVFIDADKENYLNYYKLLYPKLRRGGFIIADNAFWDGKVLTNAQDKETKGIMEFNDFIKNDDRVGNVLLTIRDGIMLIRKN